MIEVNVSIEERVVEEMANRGIELTIRPVEKNGVTHIGLVAKANENGVSPMLYLSDEDKATEFNTLCDTLEERIKYYLRNIDESMNADNFRDKEYALANVLPCLQRKAEEDMLYETVYDDMVLYYRIPMLSFNSYGMATVKVLSDHLDLWGITYDELKSHAMENLHNLTEYEDINVLLKDMMPPEMRFLTEIGSAPSMIVLSNKYHAHGASSILDEAVMEEISDTYFEGHDMRIIPSSVHEVILVDTEMPEEDINEMVPQVNNDCLSPEEILSDHTYTWSHK